MRLYLSLLQINQSALGDLVFNNSFFIQIGLLKKTENDREKHNPIVNRLSKVSNDYKFWISKRYDRY